jgi:23S rRNA (cytosine1962-C5)-methyltransferase
MSDQTHETGPVGPSEIQYRLYLKRGRERSIINRHPWIFSGAIERTEKTDEAKPGDLGEVYSSSNMPLGTAVVNPGSQLTARVLRFDDGPIDVAWFERLFKRAESLRRENIGDDTSAYRIINAEGDGLPGLIIDRYNDYLVVQCVALGLAHLESLWLPALVSVFSPKGVIERSERARRDVNLNRKDGLLWGEEPPEQLDITENGLRFKVDLAAGQKTGFYLDQRDNRARIGKLCAGKRVLNAFSFTGGFGIYAGAGKATEVVMADTSKPSLKLMQENWELNELPAESLTIHRGSIQDYLRAEEGLFDVIILDPPPFARERKHAEQASRAYKDVNLWAMKRLAPGGYLATFSCSQHIGITLFQQIIFGAAIDAGYTSQWIARLGAGIDHPVSIDHPQGEYLTGLLLRSMRDGTE